MHAQVHFTCSAGISHNKNLAKLGSGMHKPNQQTILPYSVVHSLLPSLPIDRIRGLGGKKLGGSLESEYGVKHIGDLQRLPEGVLVSRFGDGTKPGGGRWLYRICR